MRPIHHLNAAMDLYPDTGQMVEQMRAERGKELPEWPDWCFLPMAGWYTIVCAGNRVRRLSPDLVGDVANLAAIATWRYSQGIYRFEPDLVATLTESPVFGALQSETVYRLPEWSVYIETAGRQWGLETIHGFWAHLEWDATTTRSELRLLLDCDSTLVGLPLHLGPWTITESVDRAVGEAKRQGESIGLPLQSGPELVQDLAETINPLVALVLNLCSEELEIQDSRQPGTTPQRPTPIKTKKGWRWFPAKRPKTWKVSAPARKT